MYALLKNILTSYSCLMYAVFGRSDILIQYFVYDSIVLTSNKAEYRALGSFIYRFFAKILKDLM